MIIEINRVFKNVITDKEVRITAILVDVPYTEYTSIVITTMDSDNIIRSYFGSDFALEFVLIGIWDGGKIKYYE